MNGIDSDLPGVGKNPKNRCVVYARFAIKQNDLSFADDFFKLIFVYGDCDILVQISLNLFFNVQLKISRHWLSWGKMVWVEHGTVSV